MRQFRNCYIKYLLLLLFYLMSTNFDVEAQNYAMRHYDANDGLPSSDVFHALQDTKGYIWFATDNGVSRYNGYEFTNFDISDGLAKNTILEIFEDYKGRIWFISILAKLSYFENGKIYPFKYNNVLSEELRRKPVPLKSSFFVDSLDNIYMGIEGFGVVKVSVTGEIDRLGINKDRPFKSRIFELSKKKSLVSCFFSDTTSTFFYIKKKVDIPIKLPDFSRNNLKHVFVGRYNANRIVVSNKTMIYDINNYIDVRTFKYPFSIHWLSKDKEDNIWICGQNKGAWRFNKGKFKEKPDISLLKGFNVSSVLQDNKQGYWFTTLHNGVYYLPSLSVFYYNKSNGLVRDNINTVCKHGDSLWLGYHSNYLSLKIGDKVENIKISEYEALAITKILYDTINKQTVIGTSQHMYIADKEGVATIRYNHKKLPLYKTYYFNIKDIISDNKGGYWLCGGFGFYHWANGQTDFDSNQDKNFSLRTNSIFLDDDNTLWLGTINGLWRYKNRYLQYLGRINDLFKLRVQDIIKYKDKIFVGTKGGGILVLKNNELFQIAKNDGLSSNTITSMAVLGGFLWAGSKNGLNRISFKTENNNEVQISKFTKAHGLLTNEIRQVFAVDSTLFLSTNEGLIQFNVNSIKKKDTLELPIYIKEILINNKIAELKKSYNLHYNENNISVNFEAISFKNQNNVLYKYIMKGVDTAWTYTKNRELRFSFLPPGDYELLISSMNPDEVWNSEPLKIVFDIKKPFWKTPGFIIFAIIAFMSVVYVLFRYRLNEIKKKTSLENRLNKYINQALVSQMNPHFLFNALNSINNYVLKNDKVKASKYLTKFSGLIRLVLENSQKVYVPVFEEIRANKLYLDIETGRLKNTLEYEFIVDESINQFITKIPSLLIQPFLENSIWHGIQSLDKKGEITVTISKKDLFLQIEIKDNGIGRKKSMENNSKNKLKKRSYGIDISRKRIKILEHIYKKSVYLDYADLYNNGKPTGTLVKILIPFIT